MPRKSRRVPWLGERDGVYHAFWYDATDRRTKRLSLRTDRADEAAERFATFLTESRAPEPTGLTCGKALGDYLAEHVRERVIDKRRQEDAIANLRLYFESLPAKDVGIPDCRTYTVRRMLGGLCLKTKHGLTRKASAGTVKRELSTLAAALNHAVRWKRLTRDELPVLEKPKTKASKGLWLFPEELERIRAAADQDTRDFIDLCYYTAARRKAVETLAWFQVDLDRGRINLAKPGDPDTKKHKSIVPIGPELASTLARLSAERVSSVVLKSSRPYFKKFRKACRLAGLLAVPPKDMRPAGSCSPHILRHSRATHLLQRGVPIKAVADLLGDNMLTVLRVYGHACPDYLESVTGAARNDPKAV